MTAAPVSYTHLDAEAECARYNQVIRDLGGIDLQLLGLGVNGHIGFNEPDDAFAKETHLVTLTQSTICLLYTSPALPVFQHKFLRLLQGDSPAVSPVKLGIGPSVKPDAYLSLIHI